MKIDFSLCGSKIIEQDLAKLLEFKNRWIELLSGYSNIEPEIDLELTVALLETELVFENLLFAMKEAEALNTKNTKP